MPLYFAYGSNMDVDAMARRCPRSKALGLARLERHRLAVMREGWLTAVRDPASAVHGVLWELALSDIAALDRYEGLSQGLYVKLTQPVIAERAAETGDRLFRRQCRAWRPASGLYCARSSPPRGHGRFQRRVSGRWSGLRGGSRAARTMLRDSMISYVKCAFAQLSALWPRPSVKLQVQIAGRSESCQPSARLNS